MPMTEERKKYLLEYQKKNLKRVPLDIKLEDYERIQKHVQKTGESINGFIKRVVFAEIDGE